MTTKPSEAGQISFGTRRFGRINWLGTQTLATRETLRFMAVWQQTVMAPLVTAGLFLMIFNLAIGNQRGEVMGVSFLEFLLPGILMMTVIQNAFANSSSSMVISKVQGNIVDTLMPPLSAAELTAGYVIGGILRGLLVGVAIALGAWLFLGAGIAHPIWALIFTLLGACFMAALGLIAGVYAQKFDQMAAITNFIVTPLAFLSGTFYSVEALPPLLQMISHANPFFYIIDGGRYGFLGVSDSRPWLGLLIVIISNIALLIGAWRLLKSGYRLKS